MIKSIYRAFPLAATLGLSACTWLNPDVGQTTVQPGEIREHIYIAEPGDTAACRAMITATDYPTSSALDSSAIGLLNWNIMKGRLQNWDQDLNTLAHDKDLVLIQEARSDMESVIEWATGGYWSFAPGYQDGDMLTGVATFSNAEPLARCQLMTFEPWLRSPKATNITRYALSNSEHTLVVVNIHMINFTLGQDGFREQLAKVMDVLAAHNGPVIVSGDFNTWRPARQRILREFMASLNIEPVQFADDYRVRFFGLPLDHVYVGGLKVVSADTHEVDSSDHNPLSLLLYLPI